MSKVLAGIVLGFATGFVCGFAGIPAPAPPVFSGALLVLAMTSGFLLADWIGRHRTHTTRHLCGGPVGSSRRDTEGGL